MTFVILATGTLGRLGANPMQRRIRAKHEPKEADMDSSTSGTKRRGGWSRTTWLAIAIGIVAVVAVILIAANSGGSGGIY